MRKVINRLTIFIFLFLLIIPIGSLRAAEKDKFLEELFVSDIPITYGDEQFRERILERTKGERDPIGLILTGGSARACAHIGVLKYLEEINVIPDFIVTNSMGSIIGLLYAAGVSPTQIENILQNADLSDLFKLTLPLRGGLLNPSGFRALIDGVVGKDFKLEDTPIPVMVVNDDLVTKREVRITEGNFTDVLIGSFALPAYFDPFKYKGHVLIDGGVISLAPIAAAYEYTDTVILSTTFYDSEDLNLQNLITILNISFDVGKRQNAAEEMKEYKDYIWIRCDVENYSFMAFNQAIEMAEKGYESAKLKKGELENLYKNKLSQQMLDLREDKIQRIKKVEDDLGYFGRVAASPSTNLIIEVSTHPFEDTPYYLKNSSSIAVSYGLTTPKLDTAVRSGLGLGLFNLSKADAFWATDFSLGLYPIERLRFTGELDFELGHYGSGWFPTLYFREGFDYIPFNLKEDIRVELHQSYEYSKNFALKEFSSASLLNLSLDAKYKFSFGTSKLNFAYIFAGNNILFNDYASFMQIGLNGRFYVLNKETLFVEANLLSRFKLGTSNLNVPLFLDDGYTTCMLGYGATKFNTGAIHHITTFGFNLGYKLLNSFTMGEILSFDDTSFSLYFDMIFVDSKFGLSTGFEFSTISSIIGLSKIPLEVRLGYELTPERKSRFAGSILFSLSN